MNKVEICGVNTSKLPVLTQKEKQALFEKIKPFLITFWIIHNI